MADHVPAAVRRFWEEVRALNCIITFHPDPTLHHCHGGSMTDVLPPEMRPGMAQRVNHYLVIPIRGDLHTSGPYAIDGGFGVKRWEAKFGTQVEFIDEVCRRLGINVWALAGVEREYESSRDRRAHVQHQARRTLRGL